MAVATNLTNCQLFIPHKDWLKSIPRLMLGEDGKVDPASLRAFNLAIKVAGERELDNYRRIEDLLNKIGPMICNCNCGSS